MVKMKTEKNATIRHIVTETKTKYHFNLKPVTIETHRQQWVTEMKRLKKSK